MTSSEASSYLSTVKWNEKSSSLRDYVAQTKLPQVGKFTKGNYFNVLGVPSFSSPSLSQIVFLSHGGKRVKVVAQCVRFKEGRYNGLNSRVIPVGPKLAIPDNYSGWFEILSEEGRAVKCIESVPDLIHIAQRSSTPTCVVVREHHVKAYLTKADDANSLSDKVRIIQAGETLMVPGGKDTTNNNSCKLTIASGKYMKCVTSTGDTVCLNVEQKCKFSLIAKENSISGVHTIQNLLTKRLPLMVRLVHGKSNGIKNFHNVMRLMNCYEEEYVKVMPLLKETNPSVLEIPISAQLKLLAPKNGEELSNLVEHEVLSQKLNGLRSEMSDQIIEFNTWNNNLKDSHGQIHHDQKRRFECNLSIKRSLSDPQPQSNTSIFESEDIRRVASLEDTIRSINLNDSKDIGDSNKEKNESEPYDEIDQIYDYVRGFAPLPERVKNSIEETHFQDNDDSKPPRPPAIETIPSYLGRRTSYPTAIHDIIPTNLIFKQHKKQQNKKLEYLNNNQKVNDNFENIKMQLQFPKVRIPMRSTSAGKIYLSSPNSQGCDLKATPKLFIKRESSGNQSSSRANKMFKYAKNIPNSMRNTVRSTSHMNAISNSQMNVKNLLINGSYRSTRSLSTSPLFNIRYKSLTNLNNITATTTPVQLESHIEYRNSLESSNSGTHTSSNSSGSRDALRNKKFPKLSRSLTNLFWDITGSFIPFDNSNKANDANDTNKKKHFKRKNQLDLIESTEDVNQHSKKEQQNYKKPLGTLYL